MFLKNLRSLMNWLAPHVCLLCHYPTATAQDLCQPCERELPILPQSCARCANILGASAALCGTCLKNPPAIDVAHALFIYQAPLTKLIMELKFHDNLINARWLGTLLAAAIKDRWYAAKPLPDLLIPVPLHAARLRMRGFNQAVEIGRPIAHALGMPLSTRYCLRHKSTLAQARQSARARRTNLRDAFQVIAPVAGRHIALLDDVITTGSTLNSLAKTLKKAGAKQIDVWCCAKAILA